MTRKTHLVLAAVLITSPTLYTLAQITVAPPSTEPATPPAATATAPAPKSTQPSNESVMENLLNRNQPRTADVPATAPVADTNPALTPAMAGVAPKQPQATRMVEGQMLFDRVGRLIRDEKTGTYVFEFDADSKQMKDPPIALLPSRKLMAMEDASDKGAKPVKFRIAGDVTEFHGKNYLRVRDAVVIRDLNQGIGG